MAKRQLSERRRSIHLLLKKHSKEASIWRLASKYVLLPRRNLPEVNLSKISKFSSPGDQILVPGKVLGNGKLNHAVRVAAFSFSAGAIKGIEEAGGQALSVRQLMEVNPKGSRVKIIV